MTKQIEDRWAALVSQFPPSLPNTATDTDDEVRAGQLREAIWGDVEATVLVISVDDALAQVTVNPVSLEPGVSDARSLAFGADFVPLRGGIAVWPNVTATLSFVVLDGLLAQLSDGVMSQIRQATSADTNSSLARHVASPLFEAVPLPGSGAALAIDELLDDLEALGAVRPPARPRIPIAQIAKFPLGLRELMETLGITQAKAMTVISGKGTLTPAQARIVAEASGVEIADVMAAALPLPDDLERELMEPRWRAVIRQRAVTEGEDEAREALGRSAFTLAARAKGGGREMWRQCIQTVLATEGA